MTNRTMRTPVNVDIGMSPTATAARFSSSDQPSSPTPTHHQARSSLPLESAAALAASMSEHQPECQAPQDLLPIDTVRAHIQEQQPWSRRHGEGLGAVGDAQGQRWIPFPSGFLDSGRADVVLQQLSQLPPVAFVVPALLHSACPATLPVHILAQPLTTPTSAAPPCGHLLPPFPPQFADQPDRFANLRGHLDGPGQPNFGILKYRRRAMSASGLVRSFSAPGHLSNESLSSGETVTECNAAADDSSSPIALSTTMGISLADIGYSALTDAAEAADYGQPFRRPVTPPAVTADQAFEPVIVEHGPDEVPPANADNEPGHISPQNTTADAPHPQGDVEVSKKADTHIPPFRGSLRLLAKVLCATTEQGVDQAEIAAVQPAGKTLRRRSGLRAIRSAPRREEALPQLEATATPTPPSRPDIHAEQATPEDKPDTDDEDAYAFSDEDAQGESDDEYVQPLARTKARQIRLIAPLRKTSSDGDISVLPRGIARHLVRPQWSDPTLRHSVVSGVPGPDDGRDLLALPIQEAEYSTPSLPVGKGRKAKSNGIARWRGSVMKAKVLGEEYLSEDGQTVLTAGFDKKLAFDVRFIAASLDERFREFIHWKDVDIAGSATEVIVIPDTKKFAKVVVPSMGMTASDFTSIERQLNLYGFSRSLVHRPDNTRIVMVVNEQMILDEEDKEHIRSLRWLRYLGGVESQDTPEVRSRGSAQTRGAFAANSCSTSRSVSSSSSQTEHPTPSAVSGTTRSPSPLDLPVTPVRAFSAASPRIPTSAVRDQDDFGLDLAKEWDEEDLADLLPPKRKRMPRRAEVQAAASAAPRALNRKRSRL